MYRRRRSYGRRRGSVGRRSYGRRGYAGRRRSYGRRRLTRRIGFRM